ncbi:hypothetical protein FACS189426_22330 [Bacteroidia bacterium]|nr:hypothetical protein FACS189426_22330 [Bacteroidia bacterium]GHV72023.1 hypothetical protein FACS189420_8630 [Bacteroidia bacterium]
MNKKILFGIAALAIATVSVVNVNFNSQSNNLSDVSLANVEALAQEADYTCNCNPFFQSETCCTIHINSNGNTIPMVIHGLRI